MSGVVTTGFARTDDGQQLYVRVLGDHGPPMVCCNGVGVSTFFWKYLALRFRDRFRVILWDYRGHGLSSVPASPRTADLSIERSAADLFAVLDHLGIDEPAILLGHSMGCQVVLQAALDRPERVRALIPMFGTYGRPMDTFLDFPRSRQVARLVFRFAGVLGRGSFRLLLPLYASPLAFALGQLTGFVDRYYAARHDIDAYLEHLEAMNPQVFLSMVDQMADHDLEARLSELAMPVLVFGGEYDLFTPLHRSERMAELIADAELCVLAEGSHAAIVEHPETINLRIERFLVERVGVDAG